MHNSFLDYESSSIELVRNFFLRRLVVNNFVLFFTGYFHFTQINRCSITSMIKLVWQLKPSLLDFSLAS